MVGRIKTDYIKILEQRHKLYRQSLLKKYADRAWKNFLEFRKAHPDATFEYKVIGNTEFVTITYEESLG